MVEMSVESASLLISAIFLAVIGLAHVYFLRSAVSAFRKFEQSIHELESRIVPLIEDMHTLTVDTHYELEKIDRTIERARDITDTVHAAGRLARIATATPIIKAAALAEGARAAVETIASGEESSGGGDGSRKSLEKGRARSRRTGARSWESFRSTVFLGRGNRGGRASDL